MSKLFLLFSLALTFLLLATFIIIKGSLLSSEKTETAKAPAAPSEEGASEALVSLTQVVQNISFYEGKVITTSGEIHFIASAPEVKMPFNAVLTSGGSQIGVLTPAHIREGSKVVVKGRLVKGYVEYLSANGWVKDGEVFYILAEEIHEI